MSMQERGDVTTLSGRVEAGRVVSHTVPYDQQGSQNEVHIAWAGQDTGDGPRIRVFAVSSECEGFDPPDGFLTGRGDDPCTTSLGMVGGSGAGGELVQRTIHVPGGPSQRRPDLREYRLFVVGDPQEPVDYTISITWFRGPDC